MTSRIIHSGLLPDFTNASTTFRRFANLIFFCCEFSFFIFVRSSCDKLVDVDAFQKFFDGFGAHHRDEFSGILLLQLAEFFFRQEFAIFQRSIAGIDGHVGFEVENALEFAQRHIEKMADAAGQSFEEPDVRTRAGELDVTEPFTAYLGERDFNTALVANDAAMFHALVLAAEALPVRDRTENSSAEQAVFLRLEGSVVDGFRFGYFAVRPRANLFWGGQTDPDAVKIGDRCRPVIRIRSNQCNYLLLRFTTTQLVFAS